MTLRLGVNIDHVATLRQARRGDVPDLLAAASACERGGANSIVCHLREDRRHIQDADVIKLKRALTKPLNLEMSIATSVVEVALRVRPSQITLVPERRQELTTEGGLDARAMSRRLLRLIRRFHDRQVTVSLFLDPVFDQLFAARDAGAALIELHTGRYANSLTRRARTRELHLLGKAANQARKLGLQVAAGHGLDYENVRPILRVREIEEVNIGFAIIARALFVGLERAVMEMVQLLCKGRDGSTR